MTQFQIDNKERSRIPSKSVLCQRPCPFRDTRESELITTLVGQLAKHPNKCSKNTQHIVIQLVGGDFLEQLCILDFLSTGFEEHKMHESWFLGNRWLVVCVISLTKF